MNAELLTKGSKRVAPANYRVDYAKLKVLCRQAGLAVVDLYEPGTLPRRALSEATLKKWRRGGRAKVETLIAVASALSTRLRWRVDWRDIVQSDIEGGSLAGEAIQIAVGSDQNEDLRQVAEGFRNSVVARLTKIRGLRVLMRPIDCPPPMDLGETATLLQMTLRRCGHQARLDVSLTERDCGLIRWAESYLIGDDDMIRAEAAIAIDIAHQVQVQLSNA